VARMRDQLAQAGHRAHRPGSLLPSLVARSPRLPALTLIRQSPRLGEQSRLVTIEDEADVANVIVWMFSSKAQEVRRSGPSQNCE